MATQDDATSGLRAAPYLGAYAMAFLAAWALTVVTWDVTAGGIALHPLAVASGTRSERTGGVERTFASPRA